MGNHFSNRHSPNCNRMATTASPASKATGPNQSIFAIAKASLRQAGHPLELQDALRDGPALSNAAVLCRAEQQYE
jgi:hypothetical protein